MVSIQKIINKWCNLLNPYILTVLLSLPFNKLLSPPSRKRQMRLLRDSIMMSATIYGKTRQVFKLRQSVYISGVVAWSRDILRGRRLTNQNVHTTTLWHPSRKQQMKLLRDSLMMSATICGQLGFQYSMISFLL